jgi:two-component system LytT family response regulator
MMKILIIEDERSSAERLQRLIEGFGPEYKIAASVESNAEARAFFQAGRPQVDLILSDIQLGDGLSFEALREAPASIPVIFTTAFDHYAVQAFKFNSIDYLLKPVDGQELRDALERVKASQEDIPISTTDAIAQLLESVKSQSIRYRERFLIPSKADEYLVVPASDVSHITIQDGVVRLFTLRGETHLLTLTLDQAEKELDPQRFMRVNRQFIVNAAAVEKLSNWFLGKMRIHLKGYPLAEIIVSKEKATSVKKWLDS